MFETPAWQRLLQHHRDTAHLTLRARFAAQPGRFAALSRLEPACGLLFDFSKQRLDPATIDLLLDLALQCELPARRAAMFAGEAVNFTEGRAALHVALRAASNAADPIARAVADTLARLRAFTDAVRDGSWRGHDGRSIRTVVHLGIGGSDLGPRLVCAALATIGRAQLAVRFVANVDAHELTGALAGLEPATTLFVVASKTFTTAETMRNARSARAWALAGGVPASALARHFVAVSANAAAVADFGLDPDAMLPLWDWVGGRFSLWSAVGLPIALQSGMDAFLELHAGARAMDTHFREAPLADNLPVLLALVGIWNINVLGLPTLSVAPYHHGLRHLPDHLQQLEMESNGKSTDRAGATLHHTCAPVVWGQAGTNGQHAYFQWLHQGHDVAAVDFIAAVRAGHGQADHQRMLLANCLAQGEALMRGKTRAEAEAELRAAGMAPDAAAALAPHKVFPGNRPSSLLLLPELTPRSLGSLLALYEHKVMVQGALWGIDSFDQWGVEWGKEIARQIEAQLDGGAGAAGPMRDLLAKIAEVGRLP